MWEKAGKEKRWMGEITEKGNGAQLGDCKLGEGDSDPTLRQ